MVYLQLCQRRPLGCYPTQPRELKSYLFFMQAEAADLQRELEALSGIAAASGGQPVARRSRESPSAVARGDSGDGAEKAAPAASEGGDDTFCCAMARFQAAGLEQLGAAEAGLKAALADFAALAAFVDGAAGAGASADVGALFGLLAAFAADLDAAHDENEAADAKAARRAERERQPPDQRRRGKHCDPRLNTSACKHSMLSTNMVKAALCVAVCSQLPVEMNKFPCNDVKVCQCLLTPDCLCFLSPGVPVRPATPTGPLRRRDKVLSDIRAYQRLRPEDRHMLLTEKVRGLVSPCSWPPGRGVLHSIPVRRGP